MKEKYILKKLYSQFLDSLDLNDVSQRKMYKLAVIVDSSVDNKIKTLFLISLFCNVFYHVYGDKTGQLNKKLEFKPKIKCNNFTIFTYNNDKTTKLLSNLVTYFNTDANTLLPITGLILDDLNNMNVYIQ